MAHGKEQHEVELSFSVPSVCAAEIARGETEVGLAPVAEISRQKLEIVSDLGIACRGAVRSILLFARVPWTQVRSLAADSSSRTSVQLAKIVLREKYGIEPEIAEQSPELEQMLASADAALIIGDPALRIDPEHLPYEYLDLGSEWFKLTSLPMVFAAWASKPASRVREFSDVARRSYEFGVARLAEILSSECGKRDIAYELGAKYFRDHIYFELGSEEMTGLQQFLTLSQTPASVTFSYS